MAIIITDRDELEKMTFSNLVEYAVSVGLQFKQLEARIAKLEGGEAVATNCNLLLKERVASLETDMMRLQKAHTKNSQYGKNRQVELHKVPMEIKKDDLAKKICEGLSLTGSMVHPTELDKCHRLKRQQSSVIVEVKFREKRDAVIISKKNLKGKKEALSAIGFKKGIVVPESMCDDYRRLDAICHKLMVKQVIDEKWFFMGSLLIKRGDDKFQIRHLKDIGDVVGVEALNIISYREN